MVAGWGLGRCGADKVCGQAILCNVLVFSEQKVVHNHAAKTDLGPLCAANGEFNAYGPVGCMGSHNC